MSRCLFCQIARHEIPAHVVYEDERALAFLDIAPRAPGHIVIIPKIHSATIFELPESEIGPLFGAVREVSGRVMMALNPDGLTIGINQGRVSGQAVDHLHVHVIPRYQGDRGGSIHSVVNNPPKEPLGAIARKIAGGY